MIIAKVNSFRSWRSSQVTAVSSPPTLPQSEGSLVLRTLWGRLTLSRITTAYFLFSIAHCIVQVSLQAKAFDINAHSATFIMCCCMGRNPGISSCGELYSSRDNILRQGLNDEPGHSCVDFIP
ncbi:hypothetical protein BDZ89DRAFT_647517 [Hymenopellis radicata]|nr:hypothetical protein BDZ89DRAFT_647517 [Hymenopellis radicata]